VNDALRHHPALAELRQLVAELSLVSHAPAGAYGRQVPDSSEGKGGKRPSGGDVDRPQRPRRGASEKAWEEYEEERAAWLASYQRRTPDYFRREVERCESEYRLGVLRDQAAEALEAWKRTPLPAGQEPEYGSAQWKRYIAESLEPAEILAGRFWNPNTGRPISVRYINKVRKAYRDAA
jgi:hypothetical protein